MTDDSRPVVYIVDDDAAVRESLQYLVESVGLSARSYDSVEAWRHDFDPAHAGCVLLDVRLPGESGLQALEQFDAPIAFVSLLDETRQWFKRHGTAWRSS